MTSVAVVFSVTSVVVVKVVGNDLFGGLVFSVTSVAVVFSVTSVAVVKVVGNDLFGGLVFSVTSVAMVEVVGNDLCPNSRTPPEANKGRDATRDYLQFHEFFWISVIVLDSLHLRRWFGLHCLPSRIRHYFSYWPIIPRGACSYGSV